LKGKDFDLLEEIFGFFDEIGSVDKALADAVD
jgi:hypothetical protein